MNFLANEVLQLVAWFLSLVVFILTLYTLMLNPRHTANRHVSGLLFLIAVNLLALGLMAGGGPASWLGMPLNAATVPAIPPALFITSVVLLKPKWLQGRWRWVFWSVYGLVLMPIAFTMADMMLDTDLWYTGGGAEATLTGFVALGASTNGTLGPFIRMVNIYIMGIAPLFFVLYAALLDKKAAKAARRLAWLLLVVQVATVLYQVLLSNLVGDAAATLFTSAFYVGGYSFAAFQQMISERRAQRGRLQPRLTILTLVVAIPLLVAAVGLVAMRATSLIEQETAAELQLLSLLAVGLGVVLLSTFTWLTIRQAILPIGTLTETATAIASGDLERVAPIESEDEFGDLARAFNSMTEQLRELISSLEEQVEQRTHDLAQRSAYLEATAEVGRVAASILDMDQLVVQAVELIRERFGLYYVGLFMIEQAIHDPGEQWAVLKAGTGAAGRAMKDRGHRIRVGEGMVGWVVARGEPRVAKEAGLDTMRLATPELPATRSEAALPLRSRGRVLGALSVQHTEPGAFDEETMAVLAITAGQVAVALDNARLFSEGQEALQAAQRAYGELSLEAWRELLQPRTNWGYRYSPQAVRPVSGNWRQDMIQAEQTGQTIVDYPSQSSSTSHPSDSRPEPAGQQESADGARLSIPLKVRDEVIGVLGFRKGELDQVWTPAEIELLETFATQLQLALESARLYQDTQRNAAEEHLLGQVTARMRETLRIDTVLQTAIREMGTALGIPKVEVRMGVSPPGPGNGSGQGRAKQTPHGPSPKSGRSLKEATDADPE